MYLYLYIQICTFCFSHCHNFDNDCKACFFFFFRRTKLFGFCNVFRNFVRKFHKLSRDQLFFGMFHLLPRAQVLHLPVVQKRLHLLFIRERFKRIYLFFSACLQQFSTCLASGRVPPPSTESIYQNSTDEFLSQ